MDILQTENIFPPVYEELLYLMHNDSFNKAVSQLRKQWGMKRNDYLMSPYITENTYYGHVIIDNIQKVKDVRPIVARCRYGEGQYKVLLIEAVLSYALYGYPTTYIAKALLMYKKKLMPISEVKIDEDSRAIIRMTLPSTTNKQEAFQEFKKNWEMVENNQKEKRTRRINPAKNFDRDFFKIFLPHRKGKSLREINSSLPQHLEINSISTANIRIKKNVDESFI